MTELEQQKYAEFYKEIWHDQHNIHPPSSAGLAVHTGAQMDANLKLAHKSLHKLHCVLSAV